ncbi:MAG: hypothetical protein F6K65_31880 [Moorea sp. SIO3C2]|nr:hypothetical protein [Moorena sp. SIO3C2]
MPPLRQDKFIEQLQKLIEDFPEYAEILELLIESIKEVKKAKLRLMLQRLKNNNSGW